MHVHCNRLRRKVDVPMEFPKFSLLTSQSSDTIPSLNFLKIISILSLYILWGTVFPRLLTMKMIWIQK